MKIGTKIYFEKNTGNVILELGDIEGYVVDSTTEEDFENYTELKKYEKTAVGKIQLEFGELDKLLEVNKANAYKIDISGEKPKLIFSWIDPETEKPTEKPKTEVEILQEVVKEQNQKIEDLSEVVNSIMLNQIPMM